jgi:hypothetical protein
MWVVPFPIFLWLLRSALTLGHVKAAGLNSSGNGLHPADFVLDLLLRDGLFWMIKAPLLPRQA